METFKTVCMILLTIVMIIYTFIFVTFIHTVMDLVHYNHCQQLKFVPDYCEPYLNY